MKYNGVPMDVDIMLKRQKEAEEKLITLRAEIGEMTGGVDIESGDIGVITTKVYKYKEKYYIELWENGCNIHFSEMID